MVAHPEIFLTPPEIAKRLGVAPQKILAWIAAGELRALNLATRTGGGPRYRVAESDLAEFLDRRSASVAPASPKVGRSRRRAEVKSFV